MIKKTMTTAEAAELLGIAGWTICRLMDQRRSDRRPDSLLKPFGDLSVEERMGRFGVRPENLERFAAKLKELS